MHCTFPTYMKLWSRDLGVEITPEEWQTSFLFMHKSTISCYVQEKHFKLLSGGGTGTWFRLTGFSLKLLMYAGDVREQGELFCTYGGNVAEFDHFGSRSFVSITKFMMSLLSLLPRLYVYPFCQAPLKLKNLVSSDFFYLLHDRLFPGFGNPILYLP